MRFLWNTLFINSSSRLSLSKNRKRQYFLTLLILFGIHIIGIGAIIYALISSENVSSKWEYFEKFSTLLNYVVFFSGLILIILSIKNEVIMSQNYDFAKSTVKASSHQFEEFETHLEWISGNISPSNFHSLATNLKISISTPLYGAGVSEREANLYLDYIEAWVNH